MLKHYPFDSLGGADHGWLNAKHHFSFASYHDPKKMSFGELLVINDDRIAPHTGFDTHPHRDMEIITYVRRGAITHKDSRGNKGRTTAGNVQVMSAGTGIMHSEYNHEDEETNIFQIWIMPRSKGIEPAWDTAEFPRERAGDTLPLLVSGDGTTPLQINQDARIFAGTLAKGDRLTHAITGQAYLLVSEGVVTVNGTAAAKGDGIALSGERHATLAADSDAEILIIEVPGKRNAR
ncbi:MAG: pirin family protein [Candidatus Puniceispirillaceae bacterium]